MNRKEMAVGTDLHCHILPGVDDGARTPAVTRVLLEKEAEQNVRQIIFTPHFYADRMRLTDFLQGREKAAAAADPICEELGISYACGAEVRMVPELMEADLRPLSMADTGYLLLEWPFYGYPIWGDDLVDRVYGAGRVPIFAHVERYDYFYRTPERLSDYIADGVLCQMNAATVIDRRSQRQSLKMIKGGYVQLLASDAHNLDHRPPLLEEAFAVVTKKLGEKTAEHLRENADAVFHARR